MRESRWGKLKAIGKETVVNQIINEIVDSIIKGNYRAGMKLPNEFELIEQMQVSRNSLREAMKILSAMGIVEIKRGDGTYVCSQMNPSMFDKVVYSMIYGSSTSSELLELRQVLDESTVRFAIEKADAEDIDRMQANIEKMRQAIVNQDVESIKHCDVEFHMMLIDSCKNVFFIRIMKGVYSIFENSILANVDMERMDSKAAEYHQEILDCIRERNYEGVYRAVEDSLTTWKNHV